MSDDQIPNSLIKELRRNYLLQVGGEAVRIFTHWEFLASVVIWIVLLLLARQQISVEDAASVEAWVAVGLAVVALPTLLVFAPLSLGARRRSQLLTLVDAPEVSASLVPWLLAGTPPLIRVMIRNDSPGAHSFSAKVVDTVGLPPGPEPPWHVPWRHSRMRDHRLHPGDEEMLQVTWLLPSVTFGGQTHPGGEFEICEYDCRLSKKHPWHCATAGGVSEGFIEIKLWHGATGRLVKHLLLAVRPLAPADQKATLYEHPLGGAPGELLQL